MPFSRPRAKALFEALEPLSRQRDLRQQHERLPASAQGGGDGLEIDFSLPGAGDAVQQRDAAIALAGDQRIGRRALAGRELGSGAPAIGQGEDGGGR